MQTEFWSKVGAWRLDSNCTAVCCTTTQQILWLFLVTLFIHQHLQRKDCV